MKFRIEREEWGPQKKKNLVTEITEKKIQWNPHVGRKRAGMRNLLVEIGTQEKKTPRIFPEPFPG